MTVSDPVPLLPAASRAVTVITLEPDCSPIPLTDQFVVPVAVPLPPRLLLHVTCVTPTLSDAVPATARGLMFVVNVELEVGVVIATVGALLSAPTAVPGQPRRIVPAAMKKILAADGPRRAGLKERRREIDFTIARSESEQHSFLVRAACKLKNEYHHT